MRLGLVVEGKRVSAVLLRGQRTMWAAEVSYDGTEDLERALAALAAERPRRVRAATVGLGPDVARVKTLGRLPRLAAEHLAAHVQLHSRRYFLQNGVPLVTDARAIAGDPGRALAAATPAPVIEAIARGLESAGLECLTIGPIGNPELALVPASMRAGRIAAARRSLWRWASAASASLALAVGMWFFVQLRAERAAEQELARIRPAVEGAMAVRSDLDGTDDALATLSRAAAGRAHRVRVLADLAGALPDSAFLVSVRLDMDGRGSLAGYAPNAAHVLARLERAGAIAHGVMDGPVTREVIAGTERERFAIRFDVPAQPGSR